MTYLCMRKLQFFNTTYNLLNKFHTEKNNPFLFSNFPIWYEVIS